MYICRYNTLTIPEEDDLTRRARSACFSYFYSILLSTLLDQEECIEDSHSDLWLISLQLVGYLHTYLLQTVCTVHTPQNDSIDLDREDSERGSRCCLQSQGPSEASAPVFDQDGWLSLSVPSAASAFRMPDADADAHAGTNVPLLWSFSTILYLSPSPSWLSETHWSWQIPLWIHMRVSSIHAIKTLRSYHFCGYLQPRSSIFRNLIVMYMSAKSWMGDYDNDEDEDDGTGICQWTWTWTWTWMTVEVL